MNKKEYKDIYSYCSDKILPGILNSQEKSNFIRKCSPFAIFKDKLVYTLSKNKRTVVLKDDVKRLIMHYHDYEFSGHLGQNNTRIKIQEKFWWKGMVKYIKEYIENCKICTLASKLEKVKVPLCPIKVNHKFERFGIDLVGPLKEMTKI